MIMCNLGRKNSSCSHSDLCKGPQHGVMASTTEYLTDHPKQGHNSEWRILSESMSISMACSLGLQDLMAQTGKAFVS